MKTDTKLRNDVLEELAWEPSVSEKEITIAVKDGVVTLGGYVQSYAQKRAAEKAVSRVSGVRAIAEDIQVKLPTSSMRSDSEIAHAALNSLKWDTEVPDEQIKIKVQNGWITLDGTVNFYYQKNAAERSVRFLSGVKGVTNQISVRPSIAAKEVNRNISDALKRRAELDAAKISVDGIDGKVTLNGTVHSWSERKEAESAAWATPGVWAVDDRLAVVP